MKRSRSAELAERKQFEIRSTKSENGMERWKIGMLENETVIFAAVRSVFQYSIIPAFHKGFAFLEGDLHGK